MQKDLKFVVITRETLLEELIKRYNTLEQARFYVTHLGEDFEEYQRQHREYRLSLEQTLHLLREKGRVQVIERRYLPNFLFGTDDIVVVVGRDGLVANTMKYLTSQKVIGINPDKRLWDGVLLPFDPSSLKKVLPDILREKREIREITMAKASLKNGQHLYAVNDLFIGPKSHTSAKYRLFFDKTEESQSSSGIIVSTGLGSTGWLKSILCGAFGIVNGAKKLPPQAETVFKDSSPSLSWDSPELIFSVREPFPSRSSGVSCVFGSIDSSRPLRLISYMPENGVIFSDGIENDFLEFSSGMEACITVADRRGHLVV
ncbi:MAG: sugar kinase [Filifactor alocis]|nr:sugar kinase [Filifactor alocis]